MEGKSSDWMRGPSGPTVCRCCFAEGCYKDISTEYFWMGKREVYAEMLTETFDLNIAFAQKSGPNSNSRLICEPCISRLRDASEFKRQVQDCEKMFMQYLDPGQAVPREIEMEIAPEPEKEVKLERVKLEKAGSDDEFDDRGGFDDMDEDDLDDQPLTKLASKVPKKESVDLLDLLDNAKAEKRKSTSKSKASPAKKTKTKKESPKASASKVKPEKKKKGYTLEIRGSSEREQKPKIVLAYQTPQRRNAELILRFSTAYPFKTRFAEILCAYCLDEFDRLSNLRCHMQSKHLNSDFKNVFYRIKDNLIKVDISNLKCKICDQNMNDIDTLMAHLSTVHEKPVNFNARFGVLPYKETASGEWPCVYCHKIYALFNHFNLHIGTHFMNFSCDKCGTTFTSDQNLRDHRRQVKCGRTAYKARRVLLK